MVFPIHLDSSINTLILFSFVLFVFLQEASSWVKAIEDHIKKIISESVSHKRVDSVTDFEKKEIVNMMGNGYCADCNAPSKYTFYISITLPAVYR